MELNICLINFCNMTFGTSLKNLSGTVERNLEWGNPSLKAEGVIHLGGSEQMGPGKFCKLKL